jgi:hypothetical protein
VGCRLGLSWDDATVTPELATITLDQDPIALPAPLDEPLRELAARPQATLTSAHPNSRWIFPGYSPGRHIDAAHLRGRLDKHAVASASTYAQYVSNWASEVTP